MPLPESTVPRTRLHTRRIELEGYLREDGCFDLEATLLDTKACDYTILSGTRPAGAPLHAMQARITIDRRFTIMAAEVCTDAAPYPGHCEAITPDYSALAGMNLFDGFRKAVLARFGDVRGCTHHTELLFLLPTLALQTYATLVREDDAGARKPYQLDKCHALASSSSAVKAYYPAWFDAAPAPVPDAEA